MLQQQQHTTSATAPGARGWFRERYYALFGQRDPVEAQLRDIARQGTFGAHVSHFFATMLIVLFSVASLIALGADSMQAVLHSLARGSLDIPNAVATGVTALLVPCMDVAMLRAASKVRQLATRRATQWEMWLHEFVIGAIAVIEAGTYCYMAARYEHPGATFNVAWALIVARALAAPLLGVYLAMDRAHPATSRDILAQVELGSGAGVIRDVTEIANDPHASLSRKMELYAASAVMRPDDKTRLSQLIAVAEKHSIGRTPVFSAPRRSIVAASLEAAEFEPQEHAMDAYRAAHDGYDDYTTYLTDEADAIADEVEDEDPFGYQTMEFAAVRPDGGVASEPQTSGASEKSRSRKSSGTRGANHGPSKSLRQANREMRAEGKQTRKRQIREAGFAILDERQTAGLRLEDIQPYVFSRDIGQRAGLKVFPSPNTAMRLIGPWRVSRAHKTREEALV